MRLCLHALLMCFAALFSHIAAAHEVRPAYLSVTEEADGQWAAVWKQPVLEGKKLQIGPQFFAVGQDGAEALTACKWQATSRENLPDTTIERGPLKCRIAKVSIAGLDRTLTDVIVEIRPKDAEPVTALLRPDAAELDLRAPPQSPAQAYLRLGIEHILLGWDHLLFVIGLALLIRPKRRLLMVITAFTVAHSLSLALASLDLIFVPARPVEILIAASIVLLAVEFLNRDDDAPGLIMRRPYLVVLVVGLIHGLGFAGALGEIGLPQGSELWALLMFNVGVELGQLSVLALAVTLLMAVSKIVPKRLPMFERLLAYMMGAIGAYWVIDRLTQYLA